MSSLHPFDLLLDINARVGNQVPSVSDKSAQTTNAEGRLAIRLGGWNLLFSMEDVSEIIPVPEVTQVPGVKSWLMGIANSRGIIISVVDLKEFLGGKPTATTLSSRIVIVRSGEWSYGLLVDEILGMRHLGGDKKANSLPDIQPGLRPYIAEVFENEGQKWMVLNLKRLLNATEFFEAAI